MTGRGLMLTMLAMLALPAGEAPTLLRQGPAMLAYDLGAQTPWMPVLWDRCVVTLPAGASAYEVIAQLIIGSGVAVDDSDWLGLREGYRLTLDGAGFTIAGTAGTWDGVVSGGTPLVLRIDQPIDSDSLLLLCRQLHYANLGGERTIQRRRISIHLRASVDGAWVDGAAILIDIEGRMADQAPMLRLDRVDIPIGGSMPWRLIDWYDGRQPASAVRWRLAGDPAPISISGLSGGQQTDLTSQLIASPQALDWFSADDLQLHGGALAGESACSVIASDGINTGSASFTVAVVPASGDLNLVGDFPFAIDGRTEVRFSSSRTDVRVVRCLTHPGDGPMVPLPEVPFTSTAADGVITVVIDPADLLGPVLTGCAEFAAGEGTPTASVFRLPYRIRIRTGIPE